MVVGLAAAVEEVPPADQMQMPTDSSENADVPSKAESTEVAAQEATSSSGPTESEPSVKTPATEGSATPMEQE